MSEFDRAVEFAEMYIDSGRPREALTALAPYLASHPHDAVALTVAANAHINLDESWLAHQHAERAIAIDPNLAPAWRALALSLAGGRQGDRAIGAANQAIALNPHDWAGYFTRAVVDNQLGRVTKETWEIASKAVLLNPHEPLVHVAQGDVAFALRKRPLAKKSYLEATRLDPNNESARNALGVLMLRRRSAGAAASAFIDIVAADPTSVPALYNVRVAVTVATSTVHLIIWAAWVIANVAFLRAFSGGTFGDTSYGPPLRWSLAGVVTIALVVYVLHLRLRLGTRFIMFLRTVGDFRRELIAWLVCLGICYVNVLVAAVMPAPWFRLAYWVCMVSLIVGTVLAFRVRKHLKDEGVRLGLTLV